MNDQSWRVQAESYFQKALLLLQSEPSQAFRALEQSIHAHRKRLKEPLRVVIAGESNIGKSTFINALLGEDLLEMGQVETTYLITLIRAVEYPGDQRSLRVHYQKDGKEWFREKPFEQLAQYSRRSLQSGPDPEGDILFVEVLLPNALLDHITLLDTPGLSSYYREDSQATLGLLSRRAPTPGDLFKRVDALLYVIGRDGMKDHDCTALQRFLHYPASQVCPLNIIGIATCVDKRWPEKSDPLQAGKESLINTLAAYEQRLSHLFYTLEPVSGLLALGTKTLSDTEFKALCRLAEVSLAEVKMLLKARQLFINDPDARLPASKLRQRLLDRLGEYGVYAACEQISLWMDKDITPEKSALAEHLLKLSGMPTIEDYLRSHFIRHSFLLQLEHAAQELVNVCRSMQRSLAEKERESLAELRECFEKMQIMFTPFWRGLEVLGQYYQKRLHIAVDEVEELRHLVGNRGLSYAARLGVQPRKPDYIGVSDMLAHAHERWRYWNEQMLESSNTNEQHAADVFCQIYRDIHHKLSQAHDHLQEAQRLSAEVEAHLKAAKVFLPPEDQEADLPAS